MLCNYIGKYEDDEIRLVDTWVFMKDSGTGLIIESSSAL